MTYNLFVSYDLNQSGQNYPAVEKAICQLGPAVKVHKSLFFVRSQWDCGQAIGRISQAIDSNDYLIVIEASNAKWTAALPGASDFMEGN